MYVYNIDKGYNETEQIVGDSPDILTEYFKKKGYTDVSLVLEPIPIFDQGELKLFKGKAICENNLMNLHTQVNFTTYHTK